MSTTTAVWFSAAVFVCIVQVFLTTLACNEASNLRMGAFNSKTFGKAKWNGTGSDERKPILTQVRIN